MKGSKFQSDSQKLFGIKIMLLAAILASSILVCPLRARAATPAAQSAPAAESKPAATPATAAKPSVTSVPSTYRPAVPRREREYYGIFWGIDSLSVKAAESGELIRFTWRVLDPNKAKLLNDEGIEPFLIDPAAQVKLVVPELPYMGKMRVKNTPEAGITYWMAFSNPGQVVKRGDRVNVVIGQFHVNGLVVQ
jgi:hypothetical protein